MKRIARFTPSPMQVSTAVATHDELTQTLIKYLPPIAVALFAKPRIIDGNTVEWYSELGGQPVPFNELPPKQAQDVKRLLDERLSSVFQLADILETKGEQGQRLGALLRKSALYPGSSFVYALNGQPVILYWGNSSPNDEPETIDTRAEEIKVEPTLSKPPPIPRRSPQMRVVRLMLFTIFILSVLCILAWWVICYLPHQSKMLWAKTVSGSLPDCQAIALLKDFCEKKYGDPVLTARKNCPHERLAEHTPELAIVFDASSSMLATLPRSNEEKSRMCNDFANGKVCKNSPILLETATKLAVDDIVRKIPLDVSIGLIKVGGCPAASNAGYFPPNKREELREKLQELKSEGGTPLGEGIVLSGKTLDGVKKDSSMLVVLGSKNSCGIDPCEAAVNLVAEKPYLKINVIDILGAGTGNCLASTTGGKVFAGSNAEEISKSVAEAVKDLFGPPNCPSPEPLPVHRAEDDTLSMLGIWEFGPGSEYSKIRISWNHNMKRYEGHIIKLGNRDRVQWGFKLGEMTLKFTPNMSNNQWYTQELYKHTLNNIPTGKYSWKETQFSIEKSTKFQLVTTNSTVSRVCEEKNEIQNDENIPPCK